MLALGVAGGRVILMDEATGEVKWTVQAHALTNVSMYNRTLVRGSSEADTLVAMSPNGRFVASAGGAEENWKLWDVASGAVWMAGARHDGNGACICGVDQLGRTLFREACTVVAHTPGAPAARPEGVRALVFSPCGQRLASRGSDGTVILWDAQTGEAERRMQGQHQPDRDLRAISFSADGVRLLADTRDGFELWDATNGALLRTILSRSVSCPMVQFSPTESRIVTSGGYKKIKVWDVDSGQNLTSFAGTSMAVFSPDGRTIATKMADSDNYLGLHLFNAESGEERLRLAGHQAMLWSAAFSIDGSTVAAGSFGGTCEVWDSSTGALLRTIDLGKGVGKVWVACGRDWVRDTQRAAAFAMGHHPRLGERSQVLALDGGVVRMILEHV